MTNKSFVLSKISKTDRVEITQRVRQGFVISPRNYAQFSEKIPVGRLVNSICYANDTELVAGSKFEVQKLVDKTTERSEKYCRKLNVKKIISW